MNNWTFDVNGSAAGGAIPVREYLDVNGNAFINITRTGGTSFSFTEHAVFNVRQNDSNGTSFHDVFPGNYISATFEATGTGNFSGQFSFTGGSIKMYHNTVNQYGTAGSSTEYFGANTGTLIGTFSLLPGGGGRVDASGDPTNNGNVSIFASAGKGTLAAGYFFTDKGVDMSTLNNTAYAFTNANTIGSPASLLVNEVACQFAGFTGNGCNGEAYTNAPGDYFFVGNNGQFKFNEVPEPTSVALFGIALFGIGAMRRRVK
ncbi:hypothetical protein ASF77_11530 [Massilia sp. Leaf139]|nr:hypothetical protein ASF77_11530 [Massilia sp. Leaf139]